MLSYLMYFIYLSAITIAKSIDNGEIHEYYELEKKMEKYIEDELETMYNDFNVNKTAKTDKVELKVYYECLCHGCRVFHVYQLDRTYKKIGSYIDLKTYPYGNARRTVENGKTVITCQHGEAECYGNKLHACAIDILKNVSQSEFYNSCMMSRQWGGKGSTDMDAIKCEQMLRIDSKPIIECAKSQRGEDLLEYFGRETEKLADKPYVPYILLNGEVYDTAKEHNLMKRVCEALTHPPPPCKVHSTK